MSEVNFNNEANAQAMIQRVHSEIVNTKDPQTLWRFLRSIVTMDKEIPKSELLRDVEEFCLAVFDSLEPDITLEDRDRRVANAEGLAVGLNVGVVDACKGLSERDNAFLVKWTAVTATSLVATRQDNNGIESALGMFVPFWRELQYVDHIEDVLAIWLHRLYSAIFLMAYGRIPAGVVGLASIVIGLVVKRKPPKEDRQQGAERTSGIYFTQEAEK